MAEQLIESMRSDWEPERYRYRYHDDVLALIERKAKTGMRNAAPSRSCAAPAGGDGRASFQKHAMAGMDGSIQRAKVGDQEVIYVSEAAGILELVQLGALELHAWGSRLSAADQPDWIVLDLDPAPGSPMGASSKRPWKRAR